MKKTIIILSVLLGIILINAESIKIAAATNITLVMEELKRDFLRTESDAEIDIITGSSGKITAQIQEGAPYDVFMSADMSYPANIFEKGFALDAPVVYANGGIILFTSQKLDLKKGIEILKNKKVVKIAIADPNKAPYGKAAIKAIEKSGLTKEVEGKLVIAENISQAVTWSLTAADIGIIHKSALFTKALEKYNIENKYWVEIDKKLYSPIEQGIVILQKGKDKPLVKKFYDYILSDRAKKIFIKYGYTY